LSFTASSLAQDLDRAVDQIFQELIRRRVVM